MNDLLAKGSDWLETERREHLTRTIIYSRGNFSVEIPATVGQRVFRFQNEFGLEQRVEVRDYLVLAADLDFGPSPTTPEGGDRITEDAGGELTVYEVMTPNPLEPPWRWSGRGRSSLRIHTKKIGGPA